ncbi:hypothetical protein SNOG_10153 [Parastagonospora nodorum SN15]|uniref:Uncharacterized protein n=1 Tax=Phaeosphaeria nodorum (strain SN15 / ATCC MYA-4574 / FGSC 10173) TaxID=321614 RepID=Q0UDL1_PHANO|nr:hypothetical protein SNOG_10153 [Parastagonospora nodorum SN15]EAT82488.1 hypothetical protein SNOG_10153 [Parastagonospora nodorum SN15]
MTVGRVERWASAWKLVDSMSHTKKHPRHRTPDALSITQIVIESVRRPLMRQRLTAERPSVGCSLRPPQFVTPMSAYFRKRMPQAA